MTDKAAFFYVVISSWLPTLVCFILYWCVILWLARKLFKRQDVTMQSYTRIAESLERLEKHFTTKRGQP